MGQSLAMQGPACLGRKAEPRGARVCHQGPRSPHPYACSLQFVVKDGAGGAGGLGGGSWR